MGSQGQAACDRGELVAGAHAGRCETRFEDASDGGDEAGASGEEDAVDLVCRDIGGCEQAIDGVFDRFEVVDDPGLELLASDYGLNVHAAVAEAELRCFVVG